jgi:urate oxidase/2-oxo-4-hydroxy-4-carboxy-5-ureidoimidazoline decarboxylase
MRISYGKLRVPLQRVVKRPDGDHDVLAGEVSIEVLGENFAAAYTEGDNSAVVATDTMKNFILRESLAYDGGTLEGLLLHLGRGFLATYPVMEAVRMSGREHRFDRLSGKLFAREPGGDHAVAMVELDGDGIREHQSGRQDLRLLKVTGSAFTRFARDEYTTLPERGDRPLFVLLDVYWTYVDPEHDHVDPWEMREELASTFDDFVSESIQHLVYEMGTRALARWPQLAQIEFEAENHTRDPVAEDGDRKLYTDPFPAQGLITLTLTR